MTTSSPTIITAAIDGGYGFFKYLAQVGGAQTVRGIFPSIAPPAFTPERPRDVDVSTIKAGDRMFYVGPDAAAVSDGENEERLRGARYVESDEYHAMNLGALARIGLSKIDVLAIGLPMNRLDDYHDYLVKKYQTRHYVPDLKSARGDFMSVDIGKVLVLAQPVGAYAAASAERPDIRDKVVVVLDIGHYTLDYLYVANKKLHRAKSGAVAGGFSGFTEEVDRAFRLSYARNHPGESPLTYSRMHLEKALATGTPLSVGSSSHDLSQAIATARPKLQQYVQLAASRISTADEAQVLVLAGAGAGFLQPHLQKAFQRCQHVITASDPQFAIAQGFLSLASAHAAKLAL
jgi:plasmid segregation protein ParM